MYIVYIHIQCVFIHTYCYIYTYVQWGNTRLTPHKSHHLMVDVGKGKKNKAFGARATYILVVSTHQINAPSESSLLRT